eukprot:1655302-Pyramimonas_sp.AAC.1
MQRITARSPRFTDPDHILRIAKAMLCYAMRCYTAGSHLSTTKQHTARMGYAMLLYAMQCTATRGPLTQQPDTMRNRRKPMESPENAWEQSLGAPR